MIDVYDTVIDEETGKPKDKKIASYSRDKWAEVKGYHKGLKTREV